MRELQKRPEPVPVELMQWGSEAYTGLRKPPGKARGWGDKTDERRRTGRVFWLLRDQGLTREKAFGRIADSLDVSDETIRSRIRKEIWEFPRRTVIYPVHMLTLTADAKRRTLPLSHPRSSKMFDPEKLYLTSDPDLLALAPYSTMAHWRSEGRGRHSSRSAARSPIAARR